MVCTRRFGRGRSAGFGALGGSRHRVLAVGEHTLCRMCGSVRRVHRMPVRVRVVQANHAGKRLQRQDQHQAPADEVTNCVSHQGLGDCQSV